MISFQNVKKVYPKNKDAALKGVSFNISKGEFVFLTGVSGSGKTTLLKMLYKAEKPTSGTIVIFDKNIERIKKKKLRRRMGIVFQDFQLLKDKTVYDNVAYPLACLGVNPFKVKRETLNALETLNIRELAKKYPDELSGGQQQRVAIARAMVNKPELLICDEPTGNLDSENAWIIMNHLKELNETGMTILMTTHNEEILTKENERRVINLSKGLIISDDLDESESKASNVQSSFEYLDDLTNDIQKEHKDNDALPKRHKSDEKKQKEKQILRELGWTKEAEEQLLKKKERGE